MQQCYTGPCGQFVGEISVASYQFPVLSLGLARLQMDFPLRDAVVVGNFSYQLLVPSFQLLFLLC